MKTNKLIVAGILSCVLAFAPAIGAFAEDGSLQFSDPSATTGSEVVVKVAVKTGGSTIGDAYATLSYDTNALEFISGDNASGGDGTVTISGTGDGSATELDFQLTFKALTEGTTVISVADSNATLSTEEVLNLDNGTSTITIGTGTGADGSNGTGSKQLSDTTVEAYGTQYNIYENFTDALIPEGFTRSTLTYSGVEHTAMTQDASGAQFVYLVAGSNDPVLSWYNTDHFVIAKQISIGGDSYIFLLGEGDGSTLPSQFVETTMELNGTNYPAWQNVESTDFYLVYALNEKGEFGFYQYDLQDGTYQRYIVPDETAEKEAAEEEVKEAKTIFDQIQQIVDKYFKYVCIAVAAVFVILLLALLINSFKLGRRDRELDQLYYGEPAKKTRRKDKKAEKKQKKAAKKDKKKEAEDDIVSEEFFEEPEVEEYADEEPESYEDDEYEYEEEDEYEYEDEDEDEYEYEDEEESADEEYDYESDDIASADEFESDDDVEFDDTEFEDEDDFVDDDSDYKL